MPKQTVDVRISREELAEIIQAYNKIGRFLETVISREDLYRKTFTDGLDRALDDVNKKKTRRVETFDEFVS